MTRRSQQLHTGFTTITFHYSVGAVFHGIIPDEMRSIRPVVLLAAGSLGLGLIIAVAIAIDLKTLDPATITIGFAAGVGMGLILLLPFVIAEMFRTTLDRLLRPYARTVWWIVSLLMATSMGYLFAAVHQGFVDMFVGIALVLVFFGAMTKVFLGALFESRRKTPPPHEPPLHGVGCPVPIGPQPLAPLAAHAEGDSREQSDLK